MRRLAVLWLTAAAWLAAAEYRGQVTFGGLPVPGATISAASGTKQAVGISDAQGGFALGDLAEGRWKIEIQMPGFESLQREIEVGVVAAAGAWELKMLPLDRMQAAPVQVAVAKEQPDEGLLINGSMRNGAASPFGQLAAFGNHRASTQGLYNGGIGVILDNSALDAQPFSVTGQATPKRAYNRVTGVAAVGGPLQVRHLFQRPPAFFAAYQWTRNNNTLALPGLMPTAAERAGVFTSAIADPSTGAPFPGNTIPQDRISAQARALLSFYPLPNDSGNVGYNYQATVLNPVHQDALQSRFNKTLGSRDQIYGRFALRSTRSDAANVFGFQDATDLLGLNGNIDWSHRMGQRWFGKLGYEFSRLATRVTPYFEHRANVSGAAGIEGNDQAPMDWGPPNLTFAGGTAGLGDGQSRHDRNQTSAVSASLLWNKGGHDFTVGGDFRRQEFNYLSQQDGRGTFTFTGGATGQDFADFLLGIADTAAIAYGNADKYLRESVYDGFANDDWRVTPEVTVNAGVRWEYGAPVTERYGRLVNLDVAPGFAAAQAKVGSDPRPDRRGVEPRVGIAWRPVSGSSLVVRGGYGIYYDTSVYQSIAVQMAQQPPFSKSFAVENSEADPLTLAGGFNARPANTGNTFAVDPRFRVGYAQNWQASVQRELPDSLQVTATYLGIKGTRGPQEFLPNTFPAGAVSPCPACPTGFAYLTDGGNSSREAGQVQLRRRLHNGFTGILQYTLSKSIDDDAVLGGQGGVTSTASPALQAVEASAAPPLAIAQNWLNLRGERGLSSFDQRHVLTLQAQYTSGMGSGGGTLMSGWKGALLKEWSLASELTAGSGLPETPVYLEPVEGTGVTGTIRPDYVAGAARSLASYAAPRAGEWGNAGRNTIPGPAQFSLNASAGRTFRVSDRFNLDCRVDATNVLNHVAPTNWNTVVNSPQFGLAAGANAMRSLQLTLRLRF